MEESKVMEESKDAKRSKNFKDSEVYLLLSLVDMKKDVLENKKSDSTTFKEKEAAWRDIEKDFNMNSGLYYRDTKTLKKKYENLKKNAKRKFADEKKYVLGTGGGPSQVSEVTDVDLRIRDIVGEVAVHGNKSHFDSDAGLEVQHEEDFDVLNLPVVYEDDLSNTSEDLQTTGNVSLSVGNLSNVVGVDSCRPKAGISCGKFKVESNLLKCSPSNVNKSIGIVQITPKQTPSEGSGFDNTFSIKKLRTKTSSPISFRKKKAAHPLDNTVGGKKIELLAKAKQEVIELQKKCLEQQIRFEEQEHELRMKCIREEHIKKLNLLDLQINKEELALNKLSSSV